MQGPHSGLPLESVMPPTLLQDFTPVGDSLEWSLSELYWSSRGGRAFASSEVPFLITNDGALSEQAARLLFAAIKLADHEGRLPPAITILEIGPGSGLFAKFLLEHLESVCREGNERYLSRIRYIAADPSKQILDDLRSSGVLSRFAMVDFHVLSSWKDAQLPPGAFFAVFLNYVLDSLPITVLRRTEIGVDQLFIATFLTASTDVERYTHLSRDEIRALACSTAHTDRLLLSSLHPLFRFSLEFRPVTSRVPHYLEEARLCCAVGETVILNIAAVDLVHRLRAQLVVGGFVLLNDYPNSPWEGPPALPYQRFNGSIAAGINFPFLDRCFHGLGTDWVVPTISVSGLVPRLLAADASEELVSMFRSLFSPELRPEDRLARARQAAQAGNHDAALAEYRYHTTNRPNDWAVQGEVARFLMDTFRDYHAAVQEANAAIERNPRSPDLWNTLGDGLYYLGEWQQAHEAFQKAVTLDPCNVRGYYNLVYSFMRQKNYKDALIAIAEGLNADYSGEYHHRFLDRLNEILADMRLRHQWEATVMPSRVLPWRVGGAGGLPNYLDHE